ncbi:MAG TPA: DUF4340 domain-containing protein [Fimbriiglobus sp.]|nr:DUF4340 domain-containing protein [Fimbriiglobus sp.]
MRWLITFVLLLLVLVGGAWLVAGDRVRSALGIPRPGPTAAPAESFALVDQYLRADKLRSLKVTAPGQPTLTLTRAADGIWSQPGNWPLRDAEVASLVNALTGLHSRFVAVPLNGDLAAYGLDTPASRVEVAAEVATDSGTKVVTLRFGQPSAAAGEPAFARPTYLRVEDRPEVVRLGPDLFPVLSRPPEAYRRRRLITGEERVKLTGGESPDPTRPPAGRVPLLGDEFASVRIDGGKGTYTLTRTAKTPEPRRDPDRPSAEPAVAADRLAAVWVLETGAVRDRPDPAKLRAILTAVPDLWVESFVPAGTATGLDKPERAIAVTRTDGKPVTVQIGAVSRSVTKTEPAPPPMFPGAPPQPPRTTTEEYRYAKLKDNDLIFELRTDKLNDLFADPQELRDPALAHFETGEVAELTVAVKGQPPVKITRKNGNKDAEKAEDRQDRWYVGDLLAEASKVTELLDQLTRLEARTPADRIDSPDAAKLKELEINPNGTKVTVTAQPKAAEGDTPPPPRTFTFVIGKDDAAKKKLAVRVAGWDRVNLVDDAVLKLIDRPALAYRGRRLFDTAEAKLETVAVAKDGAPVFAVARKPKPAPEGGFDWTLTQPVSADADDAKAGQLADDLARLEVTEYVDDAPKPEDIDKKYGLAKPQFVVDLGFTGPGAKPRKLAVGAVREGKPESYARLDGIGSVFAVPKSLVDSLDQGAVALLPLQLWSMTTDQVLAIEVRRGEGAPYKLTRAGGDWKLTGPFEAAASTSELQPLLGAVAAVRADRYDALKPDPAKHGLDKPALRVSVTYQETKPGGPTVTKTIAVGKETAPGAPTHYARQEGGPGAVFVLPDPLVQEADQSALGWLDRRLLSLDPAQVTKVQIAGPTPEARVTLARSADGKEGWKAEGANFALDRPTVDALLFAACRPPVSRLAAYGPAVKWADFGLAKPEYAVTVTLSGDKPVSHTVKLGKAEPSGERYVRVDDGPAVGVLPAGAAASLARGKLDFADRTMLTFDPAQLTAIARKGKDELEVSQTGINWEVIKPNKMKADQQTVEALANQLGRLRAVKVAAVAPADLATPFGLKDPAATVTLTVGLEKPETKILKLGNPVDAAKPDGDRYALAEHKDGPVVVGVLSGALAKRLLAEPIKFRDRSLAKFVDADRLTLTRGDRTVTFAKVAGTWKVTQPVQADAEQTGLDELVNTLASLRADELAAEKPADLKPFGLDSPEAKWTVFEGDKEVLSLLVGSKEENGPRAYAKLAKGDTVALLSPKLTDQLLGEYRKRAIFSDLDASQVESVVISSAGSNFILRKDGAGWKDPSKPTDPIDAAKVTETVAALAGLKAERFVADADAKLALYGLEKPSRVIVVTQKGGTSKALQLGGPVGESGGKQVYAKLPDQPAVFVLSAADTAKLTRDRPAFGLKK